MSGFDALPLDAPFRQTLAQLGFTTPTAIQAAALPVALTGRDVIARAQTGSGKTAVFALSLLARLNRRFFGVQAAVLCPTRELADQVAVEIRRLGRSVEHLKVVTLCGGVPLRGQAASLAHGAHVVVGTPGRILDHLNRRTLVLDGLRTLVFDEADRMLDMGFVDDMVAVAKLCPSERQTLLFSATYPPGIEAVAKPFLKDPVTIEAQAAAVSIEQRFYATETPRETLAALLDHFRPEASIVFVNTKAEARDVVAFLKARGLAAVELSGDLEQRERDEVMAVFAARCASVLVATDVASRGLDLPQLDAVINDEVTPDPEVHVHRVGRTGRAGHEGLALTLVTERQRGLVRRLEEAGITVKWFDAGGLSPAGSDPLRPPRAMLKLLDGKKDKIRPGDVLGALTAAAGFQREQVGAIKVTEWGTWIAVDRTIAADVVKALATVPIKGKLRRVLTIT